MSLIIRSTAAVIALLCLAAGLAAFAPASVDLPGRWCADMSTRAACFRDWFGAFSGWAAALGALAAACMTLGPLQEQVKEARRQSDFALGDTQPEFVLTRKVGEGRLRLTATNWNRRAVWVRSIALAPRHSDKMRLDYTEDRKTRPDTPVEIGQYHLDGWIDRSGPPDVDNAYFYVSMKDGSEVTRATMRGGIDIIIQYNELGQIHVPHQVTVSAVNLARNDEKVEDIGVA